MLKKVFREYCHQKKSVVKRARRQAPLVHPLPRKTRIVRFAAHEDHESAKQKKPGTKSGNVWETSMTAGHKILNMKKTSLVFNVESHWSFKIWPRNGFKSCLIKSSVDRAVEPPTDFLACQARLYDRDPPV